MLGRELRPYLPLSGIIFTKLKWGRGGETWRRWVYGTWRIVAPNNEHVTREPPLVPAATTDRRSRRRKD